MTRPQPTAPDSRNAMVAGLLASGISVNGLQPSHNPQVALRMFTTATSLDPEMCDAWLARLLAGDQSIEVLSGAWKSVKTFGWEVRRAGLDGVGVPPGGFRRDVPEAGGHQRRVAGCQLCCRPHRDEAVRRSGRAAGFDHAEARLRRGTGQVRTRAAVFPHRPLVGRTRPVPAGGRLASPRVESRRCGDGDHRAGFSRRVRRGNPARPGSDRGRPGAQRGQCRDVHPGNVPPPPRARRRGSREPSPGLLSRRQVHSGARGLGQPQLPAGADRPGNH